MESMELDCHESEVSTKNKSNSMLPRAKRLKVGNSSVVSLGKTRENFDKERVSEYSINNLNHDCLAKILTYLPAMTRLHMENVGKKWKKAVELTWCNVREIVINESMLFLEGKKSIKKLLENCCQYLTRLTITVPHLWIYDIIENKCQNILHFEIQMNGDDENSYEKILRVIASMSKLKYFKVRMSVYPASNLCDWILDLLPDNVEEIHMSLDGDKEDNLELPDKFNTLRCLSLQNFLLPPATIQSILLNKTTLVHLDLSSCVFPNDSSSLFSHLNNLEHLNLSNPTNLNVDTVIIIAQNCRKLRHFEFGGMDQAIPHRVFRELKFFNNLEYLNISRIVFSASDHDSFTSNISRNKKLKYLNVGTRHDYIISDYNSQEIIKFKNLQYLYLSQAKLKSDSLIDIARNCLKLKILDTSFRDVSTAALGKLSNLKKLERLNLFGANNLSGEVLFKIVSKCKNLVELKFFGCENITEDTFLSIGKLKYLEELSMIDIGNVPNAMFNDLYNLKRLFCNSCPTVTDEGMMKVIDNCQNLVELDIRKTGATTKTLVHKPANGRLVPKKLEIWSNKSLKTSDFSKLPHVIKYFKC